jgi:post-segregation antitoxin (ccd killing protein)
MSETRRRKSTARRALDASARSPQGAAWESANRDAIDAYNKHVGEHGVFSDHWRTF